MQGGSLQVKRNQKLKCIAEHPDGVFIVGKSYRINSFRFLGKHMSVRIRDEKRERKDFNFISTSKNYLWKHFRAEKE